MCYICLQCGHGIMQTLAAEVRCCSDMYISRIGTYIPCLRSKMHDCIHAFIIKHCNKVDLTVGPAKAPAGAAPSKSGILVINDFFGRPT